MITDHGCNLLLSDPLVAGFGRVVKAKSIQGGIPTRQSIVNGLISFLISRQTYPPIQDGAVLVATIDNLVNYAGKCIRVARAVQSI